MNPKYLLNIYNSLIDDFPERSNQILFILNYLDSPVANSYSDNSIQTLDGMDVIHNIKKSYPPLLIHGPVCSGKSTIINSCYKKLSSSSLIPCAYFSCKGYNTARDMIRALYLTCLKALFPHENLYKSFDQLINLVEFGNVNKKLSSMSSSSTSGTRKKKIRAKLIMLM